MYNNASKVLAETGMNTRTMYLYNTSQAMHFYPKHVQFKVDFFLNIKTRYYFDLRIPL